MQAVCMDGRVDEPTDRLAGGRAGGRALTERASICVCTQAKTNASVACTRAYEGRVGIGVCIYFSCGSSSSYVLLSHRLDETDPIKALRHAGHDSQAAGRHECRRSREYRAHTPACLADVLPRGGDEHGWLCHA